VPAKRLAALSHFQPGNVHVAAFEHVKIPRRTVFAHDADQPHRRKERRGISEVDGAAADDILALSERGFDGINSDGTCNEQGHSNLYFGDGS